MTNNSADQKIMDTNNDNIVRANTLFEQVQGMLTIIDNANIKLSSKSVSIDNDLIRSGDGKEIYYSAVDIVNMFESLIKTYLKLLDINQSVEIIAHRYSKLNNTLARVINQSLNLGILAHFFRMASKVHQKLYYILLNLISSSRRIISFLKNELSLSSDIDDEMKEIVANSCQLILIMVLRVLKFLKVKLLDTEFEKLQKEFFTTFIIFIDEYLTKNECLENDLLISELMIYLTKTSSNLSMIPILINANCPQACLHLLSLSYLNGFEYDYVMRILYNIARHDEGALMLNKCECQTILLEFENNILNTKLDFIINKTMYKGLQLILNMIIALIVDNDKLPIDTFKAIMTWFSLSTSISFEESFTSLTFGFHISEPLTVIMKLCTADFYVDYILKQDNVLQFLFTALKGVLPIVERTRLNDMYLDSDILTIIALANIFWSISFHEHYNNVLVENYVLLEALEKFHATGKIDKILTNICIPHQMAPLRRAIDGIRQNLYPSSFSKWAFNLLRSFTAANTSVCSVMISYSGLNTKFCLQLYDMLRQVSELSISVDINNSKYLWEEIAETIEQSDIVLFLISKDFFYSKSCRQELTYAIDILKKPFIPVFIDPDYKTIGWLDSRITTSRHICFGTTDFMATCNALLSMIHGSLSMDISLIKKSSDVKQWNEEEVKQWFTINNILPELRDFYQFRNGNELFLYAEGTLSCHWEKEYDRIRLRFEEKFKQNEQRLPRDEFLKFINALESLRYKTASKIMFKPV